MNILYLECAMGAAGDMLMGALYELYPEKEKFLEKMNSLLPGVAVEAERAVRQGIAGTHMRVIIHGQEEGHGHHCGQDHHHHEHRSLRDIQHIIGHFDLPEPVRQRSREVYALIAQAEARAHGLPVGEIHFHEVGALDAVIDVTGVCYLMHLLAPERVAASPVNLGGGTVRCAHGVLPVPAPATAYLLEGVPSYGGEIQSELCTPTGAALVRAFAGDFGPQPLGRIRGSGVGCGTKDFHRANCLRAFWLESGLDGEAPNDEVAELKANLDDMTGEELGYAMERLLEAGALDVSYTSIQMKKNRPGILLTCLCRLADADRLAREILAHTATFGVRRTDCARYALSVSTETVSTPRGQLRRKIGTGYGLTKSKAEYEDAACLARHGEVPLREILKNI